MDPGCLALIDLRFTRQSGVRLSPDKKAVRILPAVESELFLGLTSIIEGFFAKNRDAQQKGNSGWFSEASPVIAPSVLHWGMQHTVSCKKI